MITVKIDEDVLLDMLIDRIAYWTDDNCIQDLFRDYYKGLVYSGCFDGCELDIRKIVDNDFVNNLVVIKKNEFKIWDIEDEASDSIVAFNEEEDLYLIRTY